jgi:hypothetical protein
MLVLPMREDRVRVFSECRRDTSDVMGVSSDVVALGLTRMSAGQMTTRRATWLFLVWLCAERKGSPARLNDYNNTTAIHQHHSLRGFAPDFDTNAFNLRLVCRMRRQLTWS